MFVFCNEVAHHNLNAFYTILSQSLITIHISDCCQFSDIHISQGSVATYVRWDGNLNEFVAHLPVSLSAKELRKSVIIWGRYGQEFSVLFFIDSRWCRINLNKWIFYLSSQIQYSKTVKSRTVSTGQKSSRSTYKCPKRYVNEETHCMKQNIKTVHALNLDAI